MTINIESPCPCGRTLTYAQCCQPFHLKVNTANDVETLMRSRYCAFVLQHHQYLIDTHHPDYLNGLTIELLAQGADDTEWLGLDVEESQNDLVEGTVTFKAWYINNNDIDAIYECSQFQKLNGMWYYTEGEQRAAELPKRNDKCVCYSGKKFKACCMRKIV